MSNTDAGREQRLGTDKMLPLMMRMALPMVFAQLVNLLYGIIDRIYLGHIEGIGGDALTGVGISAPVVMLIAAFSSLVGGGGSPLASIALGRAERTEASLILNNGAFMLVAVAVPLTLLPFPFMEEILRFAGASDTTLVYAEEYLSVYLLGAVFVLLGTGLNMFISCQGRPGIAMLSVVIGAVLNIALDPIFIFALDMGVGGAAIATVISQAVSAVWVVGFLLSKKRTVRLLGGFMKIRPDIIGKISALGVAPFIMAATESVVGFALNGQLLAYGSDSHVGALAVMQSAMQAVSVPLIGFGQGIMPIISYNFGHRRPDRVKECYKFALIIMFTFNLIGMLFMISFPKTIAGIFTEDREIRAIVIEYLPLFLTGMTIFGLQRCCQNTFVALGQARISLFIALLRKIILLVPLAIILPRFLGVAGVYTAEAVADGTAAILCTTIFCIMFPRILSEKSGGEDIPVAEQKE